MDGLQISEVAARTGFSASALRYYEDVGLLTPARSDGGYRLYDDPTIDRLRFVARAKELGLNLAEIRELVTLWEGDRCAPVADRLRTVVADKVADTQRQIATLAEFAAQLQRAVAGIDQGETSGACGPACACHHEPDADVGPVAVQLTRVNGEQERTHTEPRTQVDAPAIACTLSSEHMATRLEDWQALVARSVGREPVDGGVRLHFEPGAELAVDVARLAVAEQACCSFFEFTVRIGSGGTDLAVRAPAEAMVLVDALFGPAA